MEELYKKYMNIASLHFSKVKELDLKEISEFMSSIDDELTTEKQKINHVDKDRNIYRLREEGLIKTYLEPLLYKNIFEIFSKKLNVILKNSDITFMDKDCTEKKFICSEKEKKNEKLTGCFKCLKVSDHGVRFTNKYIEENFFNNPTNYSEFGITIKTKLPIVNKSIKTLNITYEKKTTAFDGTKWKHLSYSLRATHTDFSLINEIFNVIKLAWKKINDEKECKRYCDSKFCFMIHWLFCIATPFIRGSAGCAKVLLNAALIKCGYHAVKETSYYYKETDWVAMFSPTFEEYYKKLMICLK